MNCVRKSSVTYSGLLRSCIGFGTCVVQRGAPVRSWLNGGFWKNDQSEAILRVLLETSGVLHVFT